jgi:tight adherence protein B
MSNEILILGAVLVAALGFGAIIYTLMLPLLNGQRKSDDRLQSVSESARNRSSNRKAEETANNRKKQVADTLKELEDRQRASEKVSLRVRLERSGLGMDVKTFWIVSAVLGVVLGFGSFIMDPNMHPGIPVAFGIAGALGLPRFIVKKATERRHKKFLDEFANAIDVIVRGVKSGLPLNECLNIIAKESPDPVGPEFKEVCDQQRVGVPLSECFERMMQRMPLAEVRFFAIVIAIQQQAGGNLSEALGNLSGVLRDRKRMQAKIRALSAEAKASAGVLACLPFAVTILLYIVAPAYVSLLWQKQYGQFMMLCAAGLMSIGVFVMRKMINFKF